MKAIRGSDTVARYGGEEFTLVLPHTNSEGALVLAERIRSELELQDFSPRGATGPARITVSIGVASFPADAKTKDELISCADLALARAKKKGKNRVCRAGS
jgi:diguanylate cyclase (GGDEF)-like protein